MAGKRGQQSRVEGRGAGRERRLIQTMQPKADSPVSATTKRESDIRARWAWVEALVGTDRMLAALGNGVRGGQWYSLIDKVYAHDCFHRSEAIHQRWPNAYFAELGLFTLKQAWLEASQSR